MDFHGINNKAIFSKVIRIENKRYNNRNLPKIKNKENTLDKVSKVDEPVKITNNYNINKNIGIQNNLKNNLNVNGGNKKPLNSLKHINKAMALPSLNSSGIKRNDSIKTKNTMDNSMTRTESEISFRTNKTNFTHRNNSFTQSEKPKKRTKLRVDGPKPLIHTSHSISRNDNKDCIYLNTDLISDERYIQERKVFNELDKIEQIKNNFFTKPKLDAIDLSKVKKNTDAKKITIQNEDNIKKKEDNQINGGVIDERKKEAEIKHVQNEIYDTKNDYIKSETMIKLDNNNIDEINDNIKEDIKIMPDQKSIIDNNNIKKELEIKPEKNSIIVDKNVKKETKVKLDQNNIINNNYIKTDTELKLAQNNIGNNNNIKTYTDVKLDQNNIGNNKNIKTDTKFKNNIGNNENIKTDAEIKFGQNKISVNNGEESETKIILENAFIKNNEKQMKRNNTLDKINLLLMNKNNKNKRESSSYDITRNSNQNRNNNYLNNNNNYVPNNYCNNNFCLPTINRVNNNYNNNNNLYNNNNYNNYNSYKNLNNNYFKIDYNYYSNNNLNNI